MACVKAEVVVVLFVCDKSISCSLKIRCTQIPSCNSKMDGVPVLYEAK